MKTGEVSTLCLVRYVSVSLFYWRSVRETAKTNNNEYYVLSSFTKPGRHKCMSNAIDAWNHLLQTFIPALKQRKRLPSSTLEDETTTSSVQRFTKFRPTEAVSINLCVGEKEYLFA